MIEIIGSVVNSSAGHPTAEVRWWPLSQSTRLASWLLYDIISLADPKNDPNRLVVRDVQSFLL